MGSVEADRVDQFVPLTEVRRIFERRWALTDLARRTGGPARYVRTEEGGTIGFITPLSRNFCDGCNRVRVTCTGQMYMCLGQDAKADLRTPLRAGADDSLLDAASTRHRPKATATLCNAKGAAPAVARTCRQGRRDCDDPFFGPAAGSRGTRR